VLGPQRLQLAIRLREIAQRVAGMRIAVEKRKLPLWRQERLVIVGPMEIDQFVAEFLENSQRRRGSVDKLAVRAGRGKTAFTISSLSLLSTPDSSRSGFICFNSAPAKTASTVPESAPVRIQRFVRPFAEKQLQRANDD